VEAGGAVWAILSDIHGNLEALQAVLRDAEANQVDEIWCLGDTVGYGPNPLECLTLSLQWEVVLRGNFDEVALSHDDLSGWTALSAARSIRWTRSLFDSSGDGAGCRAFLAALVPIHHEGDTVLVHGSPRNPLHEYVFPEDIHNEQKMRRIAEVMGLRCFNGHTHVPGIFVEDAAGSWRYISPSECTDGYRFGARRVLCNVGSVGQPRDGDWRACYVLFDGKVVRFRRVEYDIEKTVEKIAANPELENWLGDRLREGR
jgi:diadenosine tetraphosphatase ApaH/serine/threonine PP2A family protein phosphatase